MPRAKGGVVTRRRHKKVLNLTKGHRATRHKLFAKAQDSMMHALDYSYVHRRERRGDFRRLWIQRISAGARSEGTTYRAFIHGLTRAEVALNRKMLAEIALNDPAAFTSLVKLAGESSQN